MVQVAREQNTEKIMASRIKIVIRGAVQGVGFRPFVYRLASDLGLKGWVINSSSGVFIEAEAEKLKLDEFVLRIQREKPTRSFIQSFEFSYLDPVGYNKFEIKKSDEEGSRTVLMLPDIATCDECKKDIFDPNNRRYLYPFTNCTNCGPRYSIIEKLPYDRINTSMKIFEMCDECKKEYKDPLNRRFHAQPNACPVCGPKLELWDTKGKVISEKHYALLEAVNAVKYGKIVALKGIGGFHLIADARNEDAVRKLRKRKHREEKPLALMYPNIDSVYCDCEVSEFEKRLLLSPESPIVLLKQQEETELAESVAPCNPYLGIMLPYSPLHHILMKELAFPIIATSGNLSDEPICIDENEALIRLNDIADMFLVHNRPIVRHVDDSIARIISDREMLIRRARGYAPLPVQLNRKIPSLLAVGAHLKNNISVSVNNNVFISQHIGDLETAEAYSAFEHVIDDFMNIYEVKPEAVVCDKHPNYLSTSYANHSGLKIESIQHHYAHIASSMAENELTGNVLGVSWDGTGYGDDGTIWGGEFFIANEKFYKRIAHLRTFKLPGGETAIKEIHRTAIGLLYEMFGEKVFEQKDLMPVKNIPDKELKILQIMLAGNINSPVTSSAGRLFDAVSSITGISDYSHYEGQAAMQLEFTIDSELTNESYPFEINDRTEKNSDAKFIIDWEPIIINIIEDLNKQVLKSIISAKFHNTLANAVLEIAKKTGKKRVVLSGGCFQNKYLIEKTIKMLQKEDFKPYWHQRVPTNDGGISLGQIAAAANNFYRGEN
jgi:hydrogenase maturation protein HypF